MPKMRSCFWFSCFCFLLIFGMRPARAFCQPQKLLAIFWVSCQLFSLSLSPSLCLVMWVLIVLFECHYVCKHSDRRRYCLLFFLVAPVVSSFFFFSFFFCLSAYAASLWLLMMMKMIMTIVMMSCHSEFLFISMLILCVCVSL